MISRLIASPTLYLPHRRSYQCICQLAAPTPTLRLAGARLFSTTRSHSDDFINHYEVLKLPQNCSQAELKKNTPFPNPDNSTPSPARPTQTSTEATPTPPPTSPRSPNPTPSSPTRADGNATTATSCAGLSKRRGTFRGPPPSFYAHGGKDTTSSSSSSSSAHFSAAENTPPNFNPHPVHSTQTHEDVRRQSRREAAMAAAQREMEDDAGFWVRFVIVTGLLIGGVSVAGVFLGVGGFVRGEGGVDEGGWKSA
ncbi:hypothetical protein EPUS_00766 [Endocarpon pusillum Z07020]|uniref:Uncharacterized protein n=1 Tax=Endocarpon pusillum (strain Z07020 / HMAS-L-300199) TaxID=1263415 RepID=U1GRP0_ENDPU|nr:uncharacterized protein EPUS_00766 [Endocarpon pusillum Z07020]ERF74636.1 hypothetical protein EPUS_00766 [Endocarpon pusillum Z07020]